VQDTPQITTAGGGRAKKQLWFRVIFEEVLLRRGDGRTVPFSGLAEKRILLNDCVAQPFELKMELLHLVLSFG
jgi:hypothetical protein